MFKVPVPRPLRVVASLAALFVSASCGGGGDSAPRTPSAIDATTTTTISAAAGSTVTPAPSVTVKDGSGRGVSGVLVRWRIVSGGGAIASDTTRTAASGTATAAWTLGQAAGTQQLEATVSGVPPVLFTAQAAAGAVTRLVRLAAATQQGVVGTAVTDAPSARAEDSFGNPVAGVAVVFSVVSGGGTITGASVQTNAAGVATLGSWTLGGTAGQQLVRATAPGGIIATFSTTAAAGPPAAIEVVSGNNQEWVTGQALPLAPTIRVKDSFNNPVGGVTVTFTPGLNSGTVVGETKVTNQTTGTASPTSWVLGESETPTLTVAVVAAPEIATTISATATESLSRIEVRWIGAEPSARMQLAVQRAIDKWRRVLVGRSGVSQVTTSAGSCRAWAPAINEVVDGLLIVARVAPIDGNLAVLANANYCGLHAETGLPVYGSILVDEDDVAWMEANGSIDAVMAHEMGHSLGFHSSKIAASGLVQYPASDDPRFVGTNAVQQFNAAGGVGNSVALQAGTQPNTLGGHWRESALTVELMTPSINVGTTTPLSRITVGLMRDIGYLVNFARADNFTIASAFFFGVPDQLVQLKDDIAPVTGGMRVFPTVRKVR